MVVAHFHVACLRCKSRVYLEKLLSSILGSSTIAFSVYYHMYSLSHSLPHAPAALSFYTLPDPVMSQGLEAYIPAPPPSIVYQ